LISIEKVRQRTEADAKTYGYFLNPDPEFLQDLFEGLKQNEERYGYPSCPCRFGACYCALYMRKDLYEGKTPISPIPERRTREKQTRAYSTVPVTGVRATIEKALPAEFTEQPAEIKKKLWYCKQCGYVVFREDPPYICPICKAKREMFAQIEISAKG
jgi:ferredoxin-thioredoxin reductase catalytic chain